LGESICLTTWLAVVQWNAIGSCIYADKFCLGRYRKYSFNSIKENVFGIRFRESMMILSLMSWKTHNF